jgi:indole-3-glycerol phosphate synthase
VSILDEIVAHKRREIARRKCEQAAELLEERAAGRPPPPDFSAALRSAPMGLIAEVKRRSPSAGALRDPFDPAALAREYTRAGAQAISVLMDEAFFGGGEKDLVTVRAHTPLPLLYKEFVVDPWQVWHAASLGASAILLIAAVLGDAELAELMETCRRAGLQPLLEVHDGADMRRAHALQAPAVGINNRNLRTFRVSLETSLRLLATAPPDSVRVSESGIREPEDVRRLKEGGADAVLVGERLLRQPRVGDAVRRLMGGVWTCS